MAERKVQFDKAVFSREEICGRSLVSGMKKHQGKCLDPFWIIALTYGCMARLHCRISCVKDGVRTGGEETEEVDNEPFLSSQPGTGRCQQRKY